MLGLVSALHGGSPVRAERVFTPKSDFWGHFQTKKEKNI